jgi:hypothetical protein
LYIYIHIITMDLLYVLHLLIFLFICSIPFWNIKYLKVGVYIPIILVITWIIFNGCPLTKVQKNLHGDSFTKNLYKYIMPSITSNQANDVNTFTLLLITVIGFNRLRTTKCII